MIEDIVKSVMPVLERVIPDVNAREKAARAIAELQMRGEFDLAKGQLEVNKQEAAHRSVFVAGWRPFLGWGLAFCFIWQGFGFQMAAFIATLMDPAFDVSRIPKIEDTTAQTSILLGMLGLGGFRTLEKLRGVAK